MRRLLVLVSALVALVTLGPMAAVGQEATPEPGGTALARTDTRYVVPYGPDGLNAGLSVRETLPGICTDDSIVVSDRADAFECLGDGDQIYDPCFENPFAPSDDPGDVACVPDPFSSEVVLLTVDSPLPREKEAPPGQGQDPFAPWDLPWALDLANGDRCTLLRGTLYQLGGQVVYYSCEQNGAILGVVDHDQPVWTVNYLADGDVASGVVEVTVAWS
jgi:hypothetical protein